MERFYAIKKQESSIIQKLGSDQHPSFMGAPPGTAIPKPALPIKERVILTVRHPNMGQQPKEQSIGEPAAKRANTSQ